MRCASDFPFHCSPGPSIRSTSSMSTGLVMCRSKPADSASQAIAFALVSGHRDEQHRLSERCAHLPRDFVTVDPAQADVDDRDVGLFGEDERYSFDPVPRFLHVVPARLENLRESSHAYLRCPRRARSCAHPGRRRTSASASRRSPRSCRKAEGARRLRRRARYGPGTWTIRPPTCATRRCRSSRPSARARRRCR